MLSSKYHFFLLTSYLVAGGTFCCLSNFQNMIKKLKTMCVKCALLIWYHHFSHCHMCHQREKCNLAVTRISEHWKDS